LVGIAKQNVQIDNSASQVLLFWLDLQYGPAIRVNQVRSSISGGNHAARALHGWNGCKHLGLGMFIANSRNDQDSSIRSGSMR